MFVYPCRVPGDGGAATRITRELSGGYFYILAGLAAAPLQLGSGNQLTGHWTPAVTLLPS